MTITDHINMQPANPLVGAQRRAPSARASRPMTDAYDPDLRASCGRAAGARRHRAGDGVYAACLGPTFETPAEIRAFTRLGADAVGMSTVPEVIVARHCGLRVAGVLRHHQPGRRAWRGMLSHEQTLRQAAAGGGEAARRSSTGVSCESARRWRLKTMRRWRGGRSPLLDLTSLNDDDTPDDDRGAVRARPTPIRQRRRRSASIRAS